jgi:transketolase
MIRHDVRFPAKRVHDLQHIAESLRREIVDVLADIGHDHRGHPGGALSIADIVTALYFHVMRIDPTRPDWADRDRFMLSKGHGCMALYVALARRGYFDPSHLRTFRAVNSILQGHPDMRRTPGVDMTSGSLGHGVSAAAGIALDLRARRSPAHVYVLLGDGELQEGLVWEGAMAAAKYRLDNLTAFVDCNRLQSGGRVEDVMPLEPLGAKWRAFGWRVLAIDGHDLRRIVRAATAARTENRPTVILARTIKGKGVAYMEGDNRWHQACPPGATPAALPALSQTSHAPVRRRSTRAAFGQAVLELAAQDSEVMAITSDTCSSMGLDDFARQYPERHIEVGIAEQNLVTVAAGLAASGRTVFVATYATFASMRAIEQVRTFLAYPRLPVVVVAGLGGVTGGIEGVAHIAMEDLGMLRCVPGLVILNPADAIATRHAILAAARHRGPVYVRLGRDDSPVLFDDTYTFTIGKGRMLVNDGWDVALLTSGLITAAALDAAAALRRARIRCTVVEFPTLKPFDRDLLLSVRARAGAIFTIEEHSVIGGLGSAVLEALADSAPALINRIGTNDRFLESGTPDELRQKYGLTADAIVRRVHAVTRAVRAAGEQRGDRRIQKSAGKRCAGESRRPGKRHDGEGDEDDRTGSGESRQFGVPDRREHEYGHDSDDDRQNRGEKRFAQARGSIQEHRGDDQE